MAARERKGWVLKARWRSSGATGAFALVEHLHVAAERERADDELGVLPGMLALRLPAIERLAEADREAQHLDAASDGDPVVTVFVDGDQQAERNDEGNDCEHRISGR